MRSTLEIGTRGDRETSSTLMPFSTRSFWRYWPTEVMGGPKLLQFRQHGSAFFSSRCRLGELHAFCEIRPGRIDVTRTERDPRPGRPGLLQGIAAGRVRFQGSCKGHDGCAELCFTLVGKPETVVSDAKSRLGRDAAPKSVHCRIELT